MAKDRRVRIDWGGCAEVGEVGGEGVEETNWSVRMSQYSQHLNTEHTSEQESLRMKIRSLLSPFYAGLVLVLLASCEAECYRSQRFASPHNENFIGIDLDYNCKSDVYIVTIIPACVEDGVRAMTIVPSCKGYVNVDWDNEGNLALVTWTSGEDDSTQWTYSFDFSTNQGRLDLSNSTVRAVKSHDYTTKELAEKAYRFNASFGLEQ